MSTHEVSTDDGPGRAPTALLVSARDATRMLGVGRTTLYELINQGRLRPVHIGRSLRIPVAELERFVEALRAEDMTSL
jgi:excisionase family DNA binding protein